MDIGEAIRKTRKDRELTQIELAEKAGIAVNSIRMYEAGKRVPSIDVRAEIADALECSIYQFLTDQELQVFYQSEAFGQMYREDELRRDFGYSFSETEIKLIEHFNKLNIHGQKEAIRFIEILAGNEIFQQAPTEAPETPQGLDS